MDPSSRRRVSSGSPYEPRIGFSRAVRIGRVIAVSGTGPIARDGTTVPGDVADQARRCFEIAREALEALGARLDDVIRTRTYLTHLHNWPSVAAIHGELFGEVRPASTLLQVKGFIDPRWRVEIELDAVVEAD